MAPLTPRRLTRRSILQVGWLTGLGLSLADYLRCSAATEEAAAQAAADPLRPTADAVIFVHLQGGPSHLDTLDMKPDAPAEERGEFQMIASRFPSVPVCEHLPKLAASLDQWTLLRGISHSAGAHPQANQYLFTGNPVSPAVTHPALGAVAVKERPCPPELPGFVAIPASEMVPGYLGVSFAPFKTGDTPKAGQPFQMRGLSAPAGLDAARLDRRDRLRSDLDRVFRAADANSDILDGLDRFGKQARDMILSERTRAAFDTSQEPASFTGRFAADSFGQSLLLATRLVEFGVRFVTVNFEASWDTHSDNFGSLKTKLLPSFDAGITALVEGLRAKGLLERTLVFAGGEFGRTPTINKGAGRDHWPRASWVLLTGGGVRPGQLIGGTDRKGHGPDDSTKIHPDDLAATLYRSLGIDHGKEYRTRAGRPVYLIPHGHVIPGVLS
ncbi:MAG: DUF1501 domain-containing protein [Pirellulaceae bacterium]